MNENVILLTKTDYLKIKNLLSFNKGDHFEELELELDRAEIVPDDNIDKKFVKLNSTFTYLNINDKKEMKVSVVLPEEANTQEGKISILAPLGSALIGLKTDQEINWMFPGGKEKTLRILEIL